MSNETCQARTKSGMPCKAKSTLTGLCSIHSYPERAAELGRRSGEARRCPESAIVLTPPRTAGDLHAALSEVFSEVATGKIGIKLGTSLAYIASVLIKTIEVSDHEVRMRAIEQMILVSRRRPEE
jgi:hypothetical protein